MWWAPDEALPRVKLLTEQTKKQNRPIDVIHLGTCLKKAVESTECPVVYDDLKQVLENEFGVDVVLGTHAYDDEKRVF